MATTPIPSPYNFVPLSKHVFFPAWAAQVSQDVPFSDGISGWFEIEVQATTPIYVRNGGDLPERSTDRPLDWLNNPAVQSFFTLPNGRFAIPGASMKGVIRSVVEVASFGKFTPVDRKRYGVRDLKNPDGKLYREQLTGGDSRSGYVPKAQPGWLERSDDGTLRIIPCDMARVEQTLLESMFTDLSLGHKQPAEKKYVAWMKCAGSLCVTASIDSETCHTQHSQPMRYRAATKLAVNTAGRPMHDPTLVFTGQPQRRQSQSRDRNGRKKSGGKHMEFVFFNPRPAQAMMVPFETVGADFLFIHSKPEGGDNEELSSLKRRFWGNGVPMPVFYLKDAGKISAVGLAMMFRLPYRFTPAQVAASQQPDSLRQNALDLAETVFGAAESDWPLKGRVHFETLPAIDGTAKVVSERVVTVLNSPKPTYYPNYVEQEQVVASQIGEVSGQYRTYMDIVSTPAGLQPGARLRGWKRYVSRSDGFRPSPPPPPEDENGNTNYKVATSFIPVDSHARFRGRVHFHNLRPCELGAILWALSWGNQPELRHRLGMGKPYGFGHIKITFPAAAPNSPTCHITPCGPQAAAVGDDGGWRTLRDVCIDRFKAQLTESCCAAGLGDWQKTSQIAALLKLATPVQNEDRDWPHPLHYPPNPKAFAEYKGSRDEPGLALLPVTQSTPGASLRAAKQPADKPKVPLPDLAGQLRQVSFVERRANPKHGHELWFRLKVEKDRFDAVLRNRSRPDLCGNLTQGQSFKLWVLAIEHDRHYLLSESDPNQPIDET
jgi:CRISPR-associated protein (TIGR03986 family)